jgi:ferredoxin
MKAKALSQAALFDFLRAIPQTGARLVAPVEKEGLRLFREVENVEDIVLAEGNTAWSFKEFLFPRTEPLFHFRFVGQQIEVSDPELPDGETVIFGARPCDAAALEVLGKVFSWDYDNPFYRHRRERTTIIGLSCAEPGPACFCTAVGLSPTGTRGSDLLLTRVGEEYLAEALTPKGEALLEAHAPLFSETAADKEEATREAEAKIRRRGILDLGPAVPLQPLFDSPRWEEAARSCLECGACAFICPTCHCFDIVDEGNARCGRRCKNWDSCSFELFTLHTSGHNPRANQPARYRQRVLHKFRYIPERFGLVGCVGCGRCVIACPVNLDIYEVATQVKEGV